VKCRIEKIIKRDGSIVRYDRDRISTAIFRAMASIDRADRARSEQLAEEVERAISAEDGSAMPSVEDIQDRVVEILFKAGETELAGVYMEYRGARAKARARRESSFEVTDNIPYKKIYEVLRWNLHHECDSVPRLNALVADGRFPGLIRAADERYERELKACAARIIDRAGSLRIAIVAGPSSSGKTTTTCKIGEHLQARGIKLKTINVDNYFFDLETHPKDQFGDYDYENPHSLDLKLINEHLVQLLDGRTVRMPRYDFKSGIRTLNAIEFRLEPGEILLIDSLHGLFRDMTASVPDESKFRLYVETLGQFHAGDGVFMRWADNRLMRRMIRDSLHRNSQPMSTLTHWHYVRRSELKNIIPFIGGVDFIVNTALPYELPILKARLSGYFPKAVKALRGDPKRQDAYIRACRLNDFLAPLTEVADDSIVPAGSLLREFIGGSRYPV